MRPASSLRRTTYLTNTRPTITSEQRNTQTFFWRFFWAAILHVLLALLLYQFRPNLSTAYTYVLLVIGLSTLREKTPTRFLYVCTYIAGAELLWRMTKADVYWEAGKYLLVLLMILGAIRWRVRLQGLGIAYFLLLIPGIILTLGAMDLTAARDEISFTLSGPLALGMSVAFLSGVQLNREQIGKLLLIGILPIISIGTLAGRSTLTADKLAFITESNFTTSGGYGPNQVSAILGLGTLLGVLYLFVARPAGLRWWIMVAISSVLMLQAVLTFSRGGLLNLVFAVPAAIFFFTWNGGKEMRRILILTVVLSVLLGWAIPFLNDFTNGTLQKRYEELDTTGRAELIQADLRTWQANPIWGVGIGLGAAARGVSIQEGKGVESHTEYSRLLAEHGMFGVAAILLLGVISFNGLRRARGGLAKGLIAGMMMWSLIEMTHAAMRIAAISFFFALPLVALNMEDEVGEKNEALVARR